MSESQIIEITDADWQGRRVSVPRETLCAAIECGKVLYFPHLNFALNAKERTLLNPAVADPRRKNISLDAHCGVLYGALGDAQTQHDVRTLVGRYQRQVRELVDGLFPAYRGQLSAKPTSLRLFAAETRQTSWRKDDRRLHVDAFPSRPNYGERILRVFANVNPYGVPRVWRVGEPFEEMAQRFLPHIKRQVPSVAWLLNALHITKTKRSEYDHLMLNLHDHMKADLNYQKASPQEVKHFAAGSVWICFSDQTVHAAMSGQFMLEQTFFLPPHVMARPECAPLNTLERLTGRVLV